jgi:hypothetical protein
MGQDLPNGLSPEQVRALLTPGPDGNVDDVAIQTADGQLYIGTPVANPDGTFRGLELAPDLVDEFDAADVRSVDPIGMAEPVDMTPTPDPVMPTEPNAETPIPDGLSTPDVVDDGLPSGTPMPRNELVQPADEVPTPAQAPATPDAADAPEAPEVDGEPRLNGSGSLDVTPSAKPAGARVGGDRSAGDLAREAAKAKHTNADGSKKKVTKTVDGDKVDVPLEETEAAGMQAAYATPGSLQIGDYAHVDGIDGDGNPASAAGFLTNDPMPVLVRKPGEDGPGEDMMAVTVSDEMDGLGAQHTVYVPLDAMVALAPRPDMHEVPDAGWQLDKNRLDVRNNRMPNRIPADRDGEFGLFPGSLVEDNSGRRGRVVLTRGRDVTVVWDDNDRATTHSGRVLRVVDDGAARPDGWSRDGHREKRAGRGVTRPNPSKQQDATNREVRAEVDSLTEDLLKEVDALVAKVQAKNLDAAQAEKELRKMAEAILARSARRRAETARRLAAERSYRPGLIAQIVTLLGQIAMAVVRSVLSFVFGVRQGFLDGWRGEASADRRSELRNRVRAAADAGVPMRKLRDLMDLDEDLAA